MDAVELLEEIDRKSLTTLAGIMSGHASGLISRAEASRSLQALFDTASGLTGREVFELISEASKELSAVRCRTFDRTLFVNETGSLVELEYEFGEPFVRVRTRVPSATNAGWSKQVETDYSDQPIPYEAAKARIEQYKLSLLRKGYAVLSQSEGQV